MALDLPCVTEILHVPEFSDITLWRLGLKHRVKLRRDISWPLFVIVADKRSTYIH